MNRDIQRQTEQLNKKRLLRQRWHRWFSIPACAVVFVTAYALILPAITLDTAPDTYCGQEEHIHTDECYEIPGVPEHTVIDCPVQQELHIHTAACYGEDGALLCRRIRRKSSITTIAFASIAAVSCSARYRR